MRVVFHMLDGSQKRWFPKVAKAAADRLSSLAQNFVFELPGFWSAQFALNEGGQPTIRHTRSQDQTITAVVFAAASWQTVDSSGSDATEQLASALLRIVPRDRVVELRRLFVDGGITHFRRVPVSWETMPDDPRSHLVLYFTAPGFELSDLHRLYDDLDVLLQRAGSGEVDGSGAGLGGYHLDVSLQERDAGLRSVFDFLRRNNMGDSARVIDERTGQQLYDKDIDQPDR